MNVTYVELEEYGGAKGDVKKSGHVAKIGVLWMENTELQLVTRVHVMLLF